MEEKSRPLAKIKVIVRAWGNEPVAMFLYSVDNTRAYVGRGDLDTAIGLPLEQVFLFDPAAFASLNSAFESGQMNNVESTYSQIAVNSICNKYQDVVKSLHEKKQVSGSRSTAKRGGQ